MSAFDGTDIEAEVDPAAEFLAREQSQLAGLEDDLNEVVAQNQLDADPVPLMNGTTSPTIVNGVDGIDDLESSKLNIEYEEPEKIKKWREEQRQRLEEKDAEEEKKKAEWREAGKRDLEEWYRHHNELILKTKGANRNAEKQFVADDEPIEPGTEWERISQLCEFNPKSNRSNRDTSRLRSIILQLKQAPLKKPIS